MFSDNTACSKQRNYKMATHYEDESMYPSSVTSQPSSTGDHDHAGLATWQSRRKTSASQRSRSQYEFGEALDGFTLDASQYTMAEPVLPLMLEDESLDWEWGALNTQPDLDRNSQLGNEVSSKSPAYNKQEREYQSSWSDTNPYTDLLWTNNFDVAANPKFHDLPLESDVVAHSALAQHDTHSAQKQRIQPDLNLDISSSSTSSTTSTKYLHSSPTYPASLSSSISPVAEDQGDKPNPPADQSRASRSPPCWTASLPLVTIEDDLSTSSKKRQSDTSIRQQGPPKKSRELPPCKMARHSVIEKRYRTKLNDELGRLRNNVPSLRVIPKRSEEYAYREGKEKLDRPQASSKFDKATIVSKAIEYIMYIEMCNKRLSEEHMALVDRLSAIETMASTGA